MNSKLKEYITYGVIIVVVILVRTFLFTPVVVVGDSMIPTLKDNQVLLLNKISYNFNKIERFDVVVVKMGNKELIKRVIGLPGETIEYKDNVLYVNGEPLESPYNFETDDFTLADIGKGENTVIPENKYLVLGDNRIVSAESRWYGLFNRKSIIGKVDLSIIPMKKVK